MKTLSLTAFCVVACLSSFGQNWQPGKLILHDGDTVRGEIDFEDWKISPGSIKFRRNGQVRSYDPSDLNSFLVGDLAQRYQLVRARLKYFNTVPVKEGGNPVDHEDSVAVYSEVLYSNRNLALYSLQDAWEDERLFIMKDGEVRELIHFTVAFQRDGRNFNQENNSYREQLKQLLKDCEVQVNSGVVYSPRAIIPVLRKYSTCKGYDQSVERAEQKGLVRLGINGGIAGVRYWGAVNAAGSIYIVSADLQILSKRSHNNNFIWIDVGFMPQLTVAEEPFLRPLLVGLYGGRYLGKGKVQPVVFTGLSNFNRAFDTGAGIAINKSLVLAGSFSLLYTLANARHDPGVFYMVKLKYYPRFRR